MINVFEALKEIKYQWQINYLKDYFYTGFFKTQIYLMKNAYIFAI